jgi:hypothetical protein
VVKHREWSNYMSKGVLRFQLPEENEEFKIAQQGGLWLSVCHSLDEWLRSQIKHGDNQHLQEARDKLNELMNEYDVKF